MGKRATGRTLAVIMALALAFATLFTTIPAANAAAPDGVIPSFEVNDKVEKYGDIPVLKAGDKVTLKFQYSSVVTPGSSFTVKLSDNVSLPTSFPKNEAIESVQPDGNGGLTITFKSPWPDGVDQGIFSFDVIVNEATDSAKQPITWEIDGSGGSTEVIIKKDGDEFANVNNGAAKSVKTDALRPYINVGENCMVTLDPIVVDHPITYTLNLDSKTARTAYSIEDLLPTGLVFVAGSFSSTLTTWDTDGLNKVTNPFTFAPMTSDKEFSGTVDVPDNSKLAISYQAKIADIPALEAELKAACEKRVAPPVTSQLRSRTRPPSVVTRKRMPRSTSTATSPVSTPAKPLASRPTGATRP